MMRWRRAGATFVAVLLGLGVMALGLWQIERRAWKHELIAAVDSRITASPVQAPGPDQWRSLSRQHDAYRHVTASGTYRHDQELLVQAVTERGGGFWVMTPLDHGSYRIWVNRGFVPADKKAQASRAAGNPAGPVTVTGLLRITEPKGGFLRANDPAADRWFSRDIAAMSKARAVDRAAPYFIDADGKANMGGYPVGGLTVVSFNDHHMIYALTWFSLAALLFYFAWRLWTSPLRQDREGA